jgi:MFS family permease
MLVNLQLTIDNRYGLITLIFFIPYVIFQPPATVILQKVGPRRFLSAIVVFWGATMIVSYYLLFWTTSSPNTNKALRDSALPRAGLL